MEWGVVGKQPQSKVKSPVIAVRVPSAAAPTLSEMRAAGAGIAASISSWRVSTRRNGAPTARAAPRRHQRLVEHELGAEAAAHRHRLDVHVGFGQLQHRGHLPAHRELGLGAGPDRHLAGRRGGVHHRGMRLEVALMHHRRVVAALHHHVGGGQRRLRVAAPQPVDAAQVAERRGLPLAGHRGAVGRGLVIVAGHPVRPHPRRARRQRLVNGRGRGQRFTGQGHRGRGVGRGLLRLGDHQRDRLADEDHAVARQQQAGAADRGQRRQIGGREHPHHAGQGRRGRGVDAGEARVRVRTGDQPRVQQAGVGEVGGVPQATRDPRAAVDEPVRPADVFTAMDSRIDGVSLQQVGFVHGNSDHRFSTGAGRVSMPRMQERNGRLTGFGRTRQERVRSRSGERWQPGEWFRRPAPARCTRRGRPLPRYRRSNRETGRHDR